MFGEMLVEARDCVFGYDNRPVVRLDHLHLHPGRCLGIFGPNGAGKTTIVRGITGLLAPMTGTVTRQRAIRFGYLPQLRTIDPHWPMTALDAACMATSARSRFGWIGSNHSRVLDAMQQMNVVDLTRNSFAKLSGGQQQRILLAGAISADPQILVLDEPTDGLDVRSRESLLETLRQLIAHGLCTVMISHEMDDLKQMSAQVALVHPPDESAQPSWVEILT